jgi:hypothetical protein
LLFFGGRGIGGRAVAEKGAETAVFGARGGRGGGGGGECARAKVPGTGRSGIGDGPAPPTPFLEFSLAQKTKRDGGGGLRDSARGGSTGAHKGRKTPSKLWFGGGKKG